LAVPFRVQHQFGRTGGGVLGTTQAVGMAARYFNSTSDDSAEAGSCQIYIADDYTTPFTQSRPVVGWEGDAIAQGAVTVSGATLGLIGVAAAVKLQAGNVTGLKPTVTSGIDFYAAGGTNVAGSTLTNFYGLYCESPAWAVTPTNQWGVYSKLDVQTEGRLLAGVSGAQTNNGQVYFKGPNVTGGATDVPTLNLDQGSGQTAATLQIRTSGGSARILMFGASGNIQLGNGATGGSGVGILSVVTTTAPTGTPVANGGFFYIDPADGDAKVGTRTSVPGLQVRRLGPSHEQILMEGIGFKSWAFDPNLGSGGTAPTAGTIYVRATPYRAGQVVTNTVWQVQTVGSGNNTGTLTSIFTGICDSTGKMVAQSNDSHLSAIWTTSGLAVAALNATWTVPADGVYYNVFLQVGTWGTTQVALGKGVNNIGPGGVGTTIFGTAGTGQTALPANGSSLTIVTTNGIDYFTGAS
jgi:hypothetical protein